MEMRFPENMSLTDAANEIIRKGAAYWKSVKEHGTTADLYAVIYMILFIGNAPEKATNFMNEILFIGSGQTNPTAVQSTWSSMIAGTLQGKPRSKSTLLQRLQKESASKNLNTLSDLRKFVRNSRIFDRGHINRLLNILNDGGAEAMDNDYNRMKDLIENGGIRQLILTGAPGTGKTHHARKIAAELTDPDKIRLVQFHPSYDYADFVEGIRPVDVDGAMQFKKLDGHFKAFCRKAAEANAAAGEDRTPPLWFFIVDEINRADLSKVFGELMFCLEKDKRGEGNRIRTQYHNLPTYGLNGDDIYKDGFYIPENVVLLGTMNDIDRSVESMDFALRRRFEWLEFVVTAESLETAFRSYGGFIADKAPELAGRVAALNGVIHGDWGGRFGLNRQYDIAQGHFASLPAGLPEDMNALLSHVWEFRIRSTLKEYLRGEDEREIDDFITTCEKAFKKETKHDAGTAP